MQRLSRTLDIETSFKTSYIIEMLGKYYQEHIVEYENAMKVYKEDVEKAMKALTKATKKCIGGTDIKPIEEAFYVLRKFSKPIDAKEMYEQYINMFKNSADETIKVSLEDANCIIHDKWDWAVEAKASNVFYSSRA